MEYKVFVSYNTEKVFVCKGKKAKAAVMAVCYGAGVKKLTKMLGSTRRAKVLMKIAYKLQPDTVNNHKYMLLAKGA